MRNSTKYILLVLLAIPYIIISIFDIGFGSLSLLCNVVRLPFKLLAEKIIDKANDINIK